METGQVEDTFRHLEKKVEERIRDASEKLRSTGDHVADFVREHPATALAGAFAVGYLIARIARR
jgi:ElaB/YqjD/DUF883 family membrane-anchored ribosome-binding protein